MIQLSSAGKRFGPKLLFDNLDWLITSDARVGLVGANGTGKSTLLKVLCGIESLDYGSIVSAKNTTFGYLPQDGLQLSGTHRLRRMHVGLLQPSRSGTGDGRPHPQDRRTRSHLERIRSSGRSLPAHLDRIPSEGRRRARLAGRHRPRRPRLPQRRLDALHRRILWRLADAHRPWASCCSPSPTCCC